MTSFIDNEGNICCKECDVPMLGIKDPEARHTCEPCGGESLMVKRRNQELEDAKVALTRSMGRLTETLRRGWWGKP